MGKYYLNELNCFHVTRNVKFFPYIQTTIVPKWLQHILYIFLNVNILENYGLDMSIFYLKTSKRKLL
jgi:hypothetical protein